MEDMANDPGATVEAAAVDPGYALAERVRNASFKVARRGYERDEVDTFLGWLADQLRSAELSPAAPGDDPDAMRRELERVGASTAEILRAAEQTSRELRGSAKRDAENLIASAQEEADRMRAETEDAARTERESADDEARKLRLEASQRADELVREAEARAESIVEDALQRRRVLAARVEQLAERRGAILAEVGRLADELRGLRDAAGPDPELPAESEIDTGLEPAGDEEPGEVLEHDEELEPSDEEDEVEAPLDFAEFDDEPPPADATEVLEPYDEAAEGEPGEEPEWPK